MNCYNSKKSLFFNQNTAWCKKTSDSLFDVTMCSFYGAKTCELVGSYLLSKLYPELGRNIDLCRDDGQTQPETNDRGKQETRRLP